MVYWEGSYAYSHCASYGIHTHIPNAGEFYMCSFLYQEIDNAEMLF